MSDAGRAQVYNLTVYGRPEYFANGVLVHNCIDALRYGLMSLPIAAKREKDEDPRENLLRRRLIREDLKRLARSKRQRPRVGSR